MLPEDVRRALGEISGGTPLALDHEVRFGAAFGASFGETHVVRAAGVWRLFTRVSFMDPFREVALSQTIAPRLVTEGFRQKLTFALADGGEGVLDVGILDQERAGTLARDWLRAPDAAPDEPAPVSAPRPRPLFAEPAAMPAFAPPPPAPPLAAASPEPPASARSRENVGLRQKLVDTLAVRTASASEASAPSDPRESRARRVPSAPSESPEPSWAGPPPGPREPPAYVPSIPLRYRGREREEPYVPIEKRAPATLFEPWHLALLVLAALVLTFMVIARLRGHR
jgi:hypothetical protein